MALLPGQILNNRYRIDELLGQGGMGAVYRAWDMNLDMTVAIKENLDTSPEAQKQFQREAHIVAHLSHPNLPRVSDHFFIPGQGQYLVMDFVEGEDLEQMLTRTGCPLPEQQVLSWIMHVCDALIYLHSQNPPIIHRDIKPANIKITPQGQAILVDFGVAKVYDPNLRTTQGARAVTSGYSPPEQYGRGSTDAQSDVYALGATLYTLLTGQEPPESIDILAKNSPPPIPVTSVNSAVSPGVSNAITHAMQLEKTSRIINVDEFKAALTKNVSLPVERKDVKDARGVPLIQTVKTSSNTLPLEWILIIICVFLFAVIILILVFGGVYSEKNPITYNPISVLPTDILPLTTTKISDTATPKPETATPISKPTLNESTSGVSLPDRIVDNYSVSMALVPVGEFPMGSVDSDKQAESNEKPQYPVYLDSFYIDIYEVTNALFTKFVEATGYRTDAEIGNSGWVLNLQLKKMEEIKGADWQHPRGLSSNLDGLTNHPVVQMSWNDAMAYCRWRGARLPTEAEWEQAARGGLVGALYPWGNEVPDCSRANYSSCVGNTNPVGSYAPNNYGLYDMAGNVWEWVMDWYKTNYIMASSWNPTGPETGDGRVLRGGSWGDVALELRAANRGAYYPASRQVFYGFRCVRSP
jgi:serine/threonine-protein kinase